MKIARVVIGLSCAFVLFAAFHASGVADLGAVLCEGCQQVFIKRGFRK